MWVLRYLTLSAYWLRTERRECIFGEAPTLRWSTTSECRSEPLGNFALTSVWVTLTDFFFPRKNKIEFSLDLLFLIFSYLFAAFRVYLLPGPDKPGPSTVWQVRLYTTFLSLSLSLPCVRISPLNLECLYIYNQLFHFHQGSFRQKFQWYNLYLASSRGMAAPCPYTLLHVHWANLPKAFLDYPFHTSQKAKNHLFVILFSALTHSKFHHPSPPLANAQCRIKFAFSIPKNSADGIIT